MITKPVVPVNTQGFTIFTRASLVAQLVKKKKNPPAMPEAWVRSLGLGRSLGEGKGYPLKYSGLENSMDCIAHGFTKSRTRLSNFHSLTIFELIVQSLTSPYLCLPLYKSRMPSQTAKSTHLFSWVQKAFPP